MAECKKCFHYQACKGTYYEVKEQGEFDGEMYAECGCDDFLPTADVVEVKHGEWKKSQFSGRSGFYSLRDVICSECGIYSTFENDVVFDPCMGSGRHGLVAIKNQRKFCGIELDGEYFNIAKERIDETIKGGANG